jgi:hypothetical protein
LAKRTVVTDLADGIEHDTKIEFISREDLLTLELIRAMPPRQPVSRARSRRNGSVTNG